MTPAGKIRFSATDCARQRKTLAEKLPMDRETATHFVDDYIVPMLKQAGLGVKVRRLGNRRLVDVRLPK